jgi:hypothetical protein
VWFFANQNGEQTEIRWSGWCFGTWILFFHILGILQPQLTNSYFSEG